MTLIYGDGASRRYTQDSPVLPDVWIAFAENPGEPQDLLLTPYVDPKRAPLTPGKLCRELQLLLEPPNARSAKFQRRTAAAEPVALALDEKGRVEAVRSDAHGLAYNQANVVVRLWFDELVRILLPLSAWWARKVADDRQPLRLEQLESAETRKRIAQWLAGSDATRDPQLSGDLLWTIRVAGTLALIKAAGNEPSTGAWPPPPPGGKDASAARVRYYERVVGALADLLHGVSSRPSPLPMVHLVSLNRKARASIWRSRTAVKADAAQTVFQISCRQLAWAILDSGIDATHPAFCRPAVEKPRGAAEDWSQRTRVVATYDFSLIRHLLSSDPASTALLPKRIQQKLKRDPDLQRNFRFRLQHGHDIDWDLVEDLIRVPHDASYEAPPHEHGTHVAGILAADWPAQAAGNPVGQDVRGVCPDINLYDLRILDAAGEGDEFSVMAALQFIRHLNARQDYTSIHGVNLSLSIPHDVRNYACGRTPVCEECERLIGTGLVVVTAAGNEGYFAPVDGQDEGFRAMRITDPGNAEGVITVGATHRDAPHTYGVSYFSSRGPTGDGRVKPDLVAPGEKIESTIPQGGLKPLDGTSMAAPHVSGAAALLMGRHGELVGDPVRIKEILCQTATDLGRERTFQGCGLVDALRALQSI